LVSKDLREGSGVKFPGTGSTDRIALDSWTGECVNPSFGGDRGYGLCPLRSTPDGRFLIFQSHADLTPPYEGKGHSEIYRYDAEEESLLCVSCDPSGAPASAEADLQGVIEPPGPTRGTTLIPNVTEDGKEVFFQTSAQLLPEDANTALDVYEWQAQGTGGCTRPSGCLSLISSGQGSGASEIYSMTPDGHDVFFRTDEKLIGSDIPGSPSIYDARVNGGFPQPVAAEPCHGDACQGGGSTTPSLRTPGEETQSYGDQALREPHCRKGLRLVRQAGKSRCAKPKHKHKRARHKRRAGR
jgi:hypothetical protein